MTQTKTSITPDEIKRLGDLAKISITPAEEERLRTELSSILDYFKAVDKAGGDATVSVPTQQAGSLRPDEVSPSDPDGVMNGVPQKKGRFVKAPRVF